MTDQVKHTWIEDCCKLDKNNIKCCDFMANQFQFRFYNSCLNVLSKKTARGLKSMFFSDVLNFLENIYKSLKDIKKLNKNDKYVLLSDVKEKLGRMVYNYNNYYGKCTAINSIIGNIIIFAQSLRYGLFGNIGVSIIEKLCDIRDKITPFDDIHKDCFYMYNKDREKDEAIFDIEFGREMNNGKPIHKKQPKSKRTKKN